MYIESAWDLTHRLFDMCNGFSEVIISYSFRWVRIFRYVTVIYGHNELLNFILKIFFIEIFCEQAWVKSVENYETFSTLAKYNFAILWEFHIQEEVVM